MAKEWRNALIFLGVVIIVAVFLLFPKINLLESNNSYSDNNPAEATANVNSNQAKEINLIFYDTNTNCKLNGNVSVNGLSLGSSQGGVFVLSEKDYNEKFKFNSSISISGRTDSCFGDNSNLPFARFWNVNDLEYYFDNAEDVPFEVSLTPRQPFNYEEMMGFVRPEEEMGALKGIYLNEGDTTIQDVDNIFSKYYLGYVSDSNRFSSDEYWQTPAELKKNMGGDCEDWAIGFVSLLRAYNSSLNCYAAVWDSHVNVICHINSVFIVYDQSKITKAYSVDANPSGSLIIDQENRAGIRSWINGYFEEYGLSAKDRKLYALFNEKDIITFSSTEEFISWTVSG